MNQAVEVANLGPEQSATPDAVVLVGGRAFTNSTELYLEMVTDLDQFCLTLSNSQKEPLGHLVYHRVTPRDPTEAATKGTFELRQMLPANSPIPHQLISLSGVLWTRRAMPVLSP
jgi:hypothetical protein